MSNFRCKLEILADEKSPANNSEFWWHFFKKNDSVYRFFSGFEKKFLTEEQDQMIFFWGGGGKHKKITTLMINRSISRNTEHDNRAYDAFLEAFSTFYGSFNPFFRAQRN